MTPKKRWNILLADDGSLHAQAAVELLQNIPIPSKSRIWVYRAFNSGQIPLIPDMERSLERTKDQLARAGYRAETEMQLSSPAAGIRHPGTGAGAKAGSHRVRCQGVAIHYEHPSRGRSAAGCGICMLSGTDRTRTLPWHGENSPCHRRLVLQPECGTLSRQIPLA